VERIPLSLNRSWRAGRQA